ncbi:MAG TPA: LLM class flavin-dependent oxidoreductase [Labilithrix sp.]|nr:LLM class flavin-dependent oxidoreductase [Labilithrix sp.]
MVAFSIVDLAPIVQGSTAGVALQNSLDLAQHAETWGYRRYWLAEHHCMPGIASSATAVAIGYIAAGTKTIRVGSGGIMLPNHSPLVIAEQFGTLESLYPGRIDLGLGRAPGMDPRMLRALRRDVSAADRFPEDVVELQALLGPPQPHQVLHAFPGSGTRVPLWILGSSVFGAALAAELGLPYGFASHFAPAALADALEVYRGRFKPSEQLDKPYSMVGCNVVVADTDAEARRLFTSLEQVLAGALRGPGGQMPPPVDDIESLWSPMERAQVQSMLRYSFVGSPETVRRGLVEFIRRTDADEIIVSTSVYDHIARLRSYELLGQVAETLSNST